MIHKIDNSIKTVMAVIAACLSVISLYTAFFGTFETMTQRIMHLTVIGVIALFFNPPGFRDKYPVSALCTNLVLAGLIIWSNLFLLFNWESLYIMPFLDGYQLFLGASFLLILLELTRRTVGLSLALIVLVFILYAHLGHLIPGFLGHRGYSIERIVLQVFAGTEGIFGIPVGVCSTVVIIFLIFGAFMDQAGASNVLLELAGSIAGGFRGGPAKVSIAASGLMGMLSGSSAANVATTGAITIPMMKKSGVEARVAGAIEAVASSGGYKTPPIMGAVAFVMANMLGVDYIDVCIAAALPAFFHYLGLFLMVDLYAGLRGLSGIPSWERPRFSQALQRSILFMIPVALMIVLMAMKFSATYACAYSLAALWLVGGISRNLSWEGIYNALRDGALRMVPITIPCAVAGIILGILTMTGAGMKIAEIIELLSFGSLFLTLFWIMVISIILGMGLPPVVSYLVLAALEVPALTALGVTPMAAHLFIFYFCALSLITPPICTTAFTAAAIAGSHPMKTGLEAVRFGIVLFTLPYLFVYSPALLCDGSLIEILLVVAKAAVGIFALAAGAQGYFMQPLSQVKRGLFILVSVLLFWPSALVSLVGGTGFVILTFPAVSRRIFVPSS
ncbi:MAG: TRAP transporter fused permease subunit [Desulfobacterales bacterium]|nr:TRAP transporter fused permease subunit [Desulfobacterales bacterium]